MHARNRRLGQEELFGVCGILCCHWFQGIKLPDFTLVTPNMNGYSLAGQDHHDSSLSVRGITKATRVNAKRVQKSSTEAAEKPPKAISILRQTLARNLLLARSDLNLSQQELADQAEVSQRMIWEIEKKQRNVTLDTVDNLATALGIRDPLLLLTPIRKDVPIN